jgi:hypothetical protein
MLAITTSHRTRGIGVNPSDLIGDEMFVFADCIMLSSLKIVRYTTVGQHLVLGDELLIDETDLTELMPHFSVDVGSSRYIGGEAAAHGSGGFFYKTTGQVLDWALMSEDSNPFVSVAVQGDSVRFLSSLGYTWVVPGDDITRVFIDTERAASFQ